MSINLNDATTVEYVDDSGEVKQRARSNNMAKTSPKRTRKAPAAYNPSKGKFSEFFQDASGHDKNTIDFGVEIPTSQDAFLSIMKNEES